MVNKIFPTYKFFVQKRPRDAQEYGGDSSGNVDQLFLNKLNQSPKEFSENGFIEIDYPFTIEFDIYRSTSGTSNTAYFSIYNLGDEARRELVKDRFTQNDNANGRQRRAVYFFAGYGGNLNVVFGGNLVEAYTERSGPDIITRIEAQDNLYEIANAISSHTLAKSQKYEEVLDILIKDLGLKKGAIGNVVSGGTRSRGFVVLNNTYDEIRKLVGSEDEVFVDNGVINILKTNEYIKAFVPLISNETGLLGVPRRNEGTVMIDILFEPALVVGQLVSVISEIDSRFDGEYKIISIQHTGTISGSVDGDRITKLELLIGTEELEPLTEIKPS